MGHITKGIAPDQLVQSTGFDLAALLASRMCHDLVSPLGAIGNGLELLQMSHDIAGEEYELISQSLRMVTARLRYFRLAFAVVEDDQVISRDEVLSVLRVISEMGKHRFDWQSAEMFARRDAKLVLLLLMCAENALPWGGELKVVQMQDGWRVSGLAHRLKLDDPCWPCLQEGVAPQVASSSRIHFSAAIAELTRRRSRLTVEAEDGAIHLSVYAAP